MYIECGEGQPIPEDYLTFTSTSPEHEQDNPRAMYEEMSTDQPLDTYEEPGDLSTCMYSALRVHCLLSNKGYPIC